MEAWQDSIIESFKTNLSHELRKCNTLLIFDLLKWHAREFNDNNHSLTKYNRMRMDFEKVKIWLKKINKDLYIKLYTINNSQREDKMKARMELLAGLIMYERVREGMLHVIENRYDEYNELLTKENEEYIVFQC